MTAANGWGELDAASPQSVSVRGIAVTVGSRVRLRPRSGGDVMDLALAGRRAVVGSVQMTTDGEAHFVVTLDDDPGRDLGGPRYVGHRFFFRADEIDPSDGDVDPSEVSARVLVAGIGNIFFGDDGFGVATARRLATETLPDGVVVRDFGIRGLDLAYALQEDFDAAILIDAMPRGGEPGNLHVLEPDLEADAIGTTLDAHVMDPVRVLRLAQTMGRIPRRLIVVGCEPLTAETSESLADELVTLSRPVEDAVGRAVDLVKQLIHNLISTERRQPGEVDNVSSGVGVGDRRNRRGSSDHRDDPRANTADAPVSAHQSDVAQA